LLRRAKKLSLRAIHSSVKGGRLAAGRFASGGKQKMLGNGDRTRTSYPADRNALAGRGSTRRSRRPVADVGSLFSL
jgi:hypothetical protein